MKTLLSFLLLTLIAPTYAQENFLSFDEHIEFCLSEIKIHPHTKDRGFGDENFEIIIGLHDKLLNDIDTNLSNNYIVSKELNQSFVPGSRQIFKTKENCINIYSSDLTHVLSEKKPVLVVDEVGFLINSSILRIPISDNLMRDLRKNACPLFYEGIYNGGLRVRAVVELIKDR